ncbi:MAG: GatB/YqeY domain-containing protein [Thermodesulfobacteriota bacterium]
MSLKEQIPNDIKNALRNKSTVELSVLRMLQSAIHNKEIDNKEELSDEQVIEVVSSEVKKRRDAASEFEKVNRPDAAQKEKEEIEILLKYMPEQLSEDQIREEVAKAIEESMADGLKDLGKVMKVIMPRMKGKADGKLVHSMVRDLLEKTE